MLMQCYQLSIWQSHDMMATLVLEVKKKERKKNIRFVISSLMLPTGDQREESKKDQIKEIKRKQFECAKM